MILSDYKRKLPKVVYIFGSGASLDYYPKNHWDRKFTVGVNMAYQFDKHLDAIVISHGSHIKDIQSNYSHLDLFVSRYDSTIKSKGLNEVDKSSAYIYDSLGDTGHTVIPDISLMHKPIENTVITCGDTVCRAIGVFVYLGVKEIRLVGCDGGDGYNGMNNRNGYYTSSVNPSITVGHAMRSMIGKNHMIKELRQYGINIKFKKP